MGGGEGEGGVCRREPGLVEPGELSFVQEREQKKECEESYMARGGH